MSPIFAEERQERSQVEDVSAYNNNQLADALLPWYLRRRASGLGGVSSGDIKNELAHYIRRPITAGYNTASQISGKLKEKSKTSYNVSSMALLQGFIQCLQEKGHAAALLVADGAEVRERLLAIAERRWVGWNVKNLAPELRKAFNPDKVKLPELNYTGEKLYCVGW